MIWAGGQECPPHMNLVTTELCGSSDCAFGRRRYERGIFGEYSSFITGGRGLPLRQAAGNFRIGNFYFQLAALGVDGDTVAFVDRGNRAAQGSFRSDVTDHQAAGGAAETSVGEQSDGFAEPLSDNRSGHA